MSSGLVRQLWRIYFPDQFDFAILDGKTSGLTHSKRYGKLLEPAGNKPGANKDGAWMQTLTKTQQDKIDAGIEQMSKDSDIIEFVREVENGIKTTQDHYGRYMSFLTNYVKDPVILHIISRGLIGAGANSRGVNSALMVLKGGE